MATINVTLKVEVDLNAWADEYGHAGAAGALAEALNDLRESGWYLKEQKWQGLVEVTAVTAQLDPKFLTISAKPTPKSG